MRTPMKTDLDLLVRDFHVGRNVDQIPEHVPRLGVGIAPHPQGQAAVKAGGDDEKGQVEVHLQADGGRQRVEMEEAVGIGQGVLDQHPLDVAGDQTFDRRAMLIGQQDGRFVVSEILDQNLAEVPAGQADRLFMIPGRAVLPRRDVQLDRPPSGTRQKDDLPEDLRGTAAEGDEGEAHPIELGQGFIGREPGIKDQFPEGRAMGPLPKIDEAEHLAGFFPLAQVGVGLAERVRRGVLAQEGQNTRLVGKVLDIYSWRRLRMETK